MDPRRGFDSVNLQKNNTDNYPSVVDRYYKKFYKINKKDEDYCVLVHSNRICLVTLAPSHPIIREKKTVSKVDFQINPRTNRLHNQLSGKRKRGAQRMDHNSGLCIVKCTDGSSYIPVACLKSILVEANDNLVQNPTLLTTKPSTEGYIAIVLTKLNEHTIELEKLLNQQQYDKKVLERMKKIDSTVETPADNKVDNDVKAIAVDVKENEIAKDAITDKKCAKSVTVGTMEVDANIRQKSGTSTSDEHFVDRMMNSYETDELNIDDNLCESRKRRLSETDTSAKKCALDLSETKNGLDEEG